MENKNIQKTTAEESSDIFAVAEDQDKKNAAIDYAAFVMQLARPLVHDEKTYTELTFNFEDLSGNDSLAIERELQMLGHTVIVANFDSEYLIRVCVKACTEKLGLDALGKLSIRDFNPLDMKRSAGFGVRIQLPMVGLLGVDWAYGFQKYSGTQKIGGSQFHFIIGQEF